MVEEYFSLPYQVKGYECDAKGQMNFPSLMKVLVHLSTLHSQAIIEEIGHNPLEENHITWIIIRYQMDIKQLPVNKQNIQLATESVTYDKLFAYRHFDVRDDQGELMGRIIATFALMDRQSRKMLRMKAEYMEGYSLKEAVPKRIKRYPNPIPLDPEEVSYSKDYQVRYFDIDSNQHVNNTLYLTWSMDALDGEFLAEHELSGGIVKFEKEVHYGDQVRSQAKIGEDEDGIYSAHRILTEDKLNAEIEYRWRKRAN